MRKRKRRIGANRSQYLTAKRQFHGQTVRAAVKSTVKPVVIVMLVTLLGVGAAIVGHEILKRVKNLSVLQLAQVTVQGNRHVSTPTILQAAEIQPNQSVLQIDVNTVADKIKAIQWVKQVKVKRKLNRSVVIEIKEREPMAWVNLDKAFLVDCHGKLLTPLAGQMFDLPVISGLCRDSIHTMTVVPNALWESARALLQTAKHLDQNLARLISEVIVDSASLAAFTITGTKILLPIQCTKERITKLAALFNDILMTGKRAKEINLLFDRVAYVK